MAEKTENKSVLRMIIPQWQGGVNPNYVFGSELLACIAPTAPNTETVRIQVDTDFEKKLDQIDGIDGGDILLKQMRETRDILREKSPDKVIVFGGDCSVTQVAFDYLRGKYKEEIGIIWLDAHPDISGPSASSHLHEMPLANLLGQNRESEITCSENIYEADKIFLAGLIEERLRDMDMACKELNIRIASPEELEENSSAVLNWIHETGVKYVAVHWDLDVLSPEDFRCIYPAEPYTDADEFPAAVGRMTLKGIGRLLSDVSGYAEIVGLSVTEHLPWDAMNLRAALGSISIFK